MKHAEKQPSSMMRNFARDYMLVSLVPMLLCLICTVIGAFWVQHCTRHLIQQSINDLNGDARKLLEQLGQTIIQEKARDVAGQIRIFLDTISNPSLEELQHTEAFRAIALQQVGKSGYTCLYEAGSGIMRVHPDRGRENQDIRFLAKRIPSWWAIFEPSLAGREYSGYYDWLDPDGQIRPKFMVTTPVKGIFAGKTLMVAATTYIDEFSAPHLIMEKQTEEISTTYQRVITRRVLILGGLITLILFVALIRVYRFGRQSALRYMLPIVTLSRAAKAVGEGAWEIEEDAAVAERKDEIGELAVSFYKMRRRLRELFFDLQNRLDELRSTREAFQKSDQYYRSLFNGVPVGLYRTAPDGQILDANPMLIRMLNYPSKTDFLARQAADMYVDPGDRTKWQRQLEPVTGQNVFEIRMRRYDGAVIWVENRSVAVRNDSGEILFYEGSLKDITVQKTAELSLIESQIKFQTLYEEAKRARELYDSLLRSSADPIVIYDLEGKTQFINPAFTTLFGWSLEALRGKRIPFVPDSEMGTTMPIIRAVVQDGTSCHGYETKRRTKDGQLIDISISASRFEDHEGKPAGLLVILRDISEKKKFAEQLRLVQRMEAIGTLAGGLAHDFNNLMMGILGNVSLMMCEITPKDPKYKRLKSIETLIQSGSKLTTQLLGYAQKGKYEYKMFDLNAVVRESAETFGRTKNEISLHLDFWETPVVVAGDKTQIEQVLLNMYANAADAMQEGGDLYLKTSMLIYHETQLKPGESVSGNYAILEITDTGVGIDPKIQEKIFDPFFTTKELGRGTGLGLASAYGIIKAHGGEINVESKPGVGSSFRIYLPVSDNHFTEIPKTKKNPLGENGTLLLVDDENLVLEVGSLMLEKMGYEVLVADSGAKAVSLFQEQRERISLVILDLVMPGMSGRDTFDALKRIDPEVKVLLSSGYSIDSQAIEIISRGCKGFIQKPFGMETLYLKLSEILMYSSSVDDF